MSLATALILAAATATAPAPEGGSGVQLATAQARATIVKAVVVRQASGVEQDDEAPARQITRRGATILIEFQ